jgi:hypothetical protein
VRSQPQVRSHVPCVCDGQEHVRTRPGLQADLVPCGGGSVSDELRIRATYHWHADAAGKLNCLALYADRRVAAAASASYGAAWSWGQNTRYDDPDDPKFYERQQRYDDAEFELLVLMRKALSIPEADLSLPPPGYKWDAPRPDTNDEGSVHRYGKRREKCDA